MNKKPMNYQPSSFKAIRIEDVIRTAIQEISTIPYVSEVNIQVDPMNAAKTNYNGKEG